MSYATIMIYVEPDEGAEGHVRLAAGLADKFGATLIGLSARAIPPPILPMVRSCRPQSTSTRCRRSLKSKVAGFAALRRR
jgi:hypothetical protein